MQELDKMFQIMLVGFVYCDKVRGPHKHTKGRDYYVEVN